MPNWGEALGLCGQPDTAWALQGSPHRQNHPGSHTMGARTCHSTMAMARDSKPCCTSHQEANSSLLELSQAAVASQCHALGREYRNTTTLCFILASVCELKSQLCLLTHPERTSQRLNLGCRLVRAQGVSTLELSDATKISLGRHLRRTAFTILGSISRTDQT